MRFSTSSSQEVACKFGTDRSEHRFRVELDTVDRELAMANRHHLAVTTGRRDLQLVGEGRRSQGVVAAGKEVVRQVAEDAAAVVAADARLSVDERPRLPDLAAEDLDDRLVATADTERGSTRREPADDLGRGAGSRRPSRPGRDHQMRRSQPLGLIGIDRVVPVDDHLGAELAEQVREVVGERVVVVDQQDHPRASLPSPSPASAGRSPASPPTDPADGTGPSGAVLFRTVPSGPAPPAAPEETERASASSSARSSAASFRRHSSCSALGEESATIPAPAWGYATPSLSSIVGIAMQVS